VTWRAPYFDLCSGLFVPQLVIRDPENCEFTRVEGPKGFEDAGGGGRGGECS